MKNPMKSHTIKHSGQMVSPKLKGDSYNYMNDVGRSSGIKQTAQKLSKGMDGFSRKMGVPKPAMLKGKGC